MLDDSHAAMLLLVRDVRKSYPRRYSNSPWATTEVIVGSFKLRTLSGTVLSAITVAV